MAGRTELGRTESQRERKDGVWRARERSEAIEASFGASPFEVQQEQLMGEGRQSTTPTQLSLLPLPPSSSSSPSSACTRSPSSCEGPPADPPRQGSIQEVARLLPLRHFLPRLLSSRRLLLLRCSSSIQRYQLSQERRQEEQDPQADYRRREGARR